MNERMRDWLYGAIDFWRLGLEGAIYLSSTLAWISGIIAAPIFLYNQQWLAALAAFAVSVIGSAIAGRILS